MRGTGALRTSVAPGGALAGPWVRNDLWRRARAVPSLDLRFADNKSLVDATTGQNLITFTRASSGTYVDSQGVIRTATTNLLLRSEEFDNTTVWGNSVGTVTRNANATTAPNGTLTADELVFTAADNTVAQSVTIVSGISYAVSIWIKGTAGQTIRFTANSIPGGSNVTLTGEWVRYSFVGTSTGTNATLNLSTFGGVTARNIFVWGAQLEQSSTVGEYIPTTSTINSAPRFDHNPTTGESLGLLVEEQRTNSFTYSEQADNAAWTLSNLLAFGSGSVANATTSPDGTTTADKIVENTIAGVAHEIRTPSVSLTSGITYTASIFAKASEKRYLRFGYGGGWGTANNYAVFDLQTGTSTYSNAAITPRITALPSGWYRCSITYTVVTTATSTLYVGLNSDSTTGTTYTGNGVDGIFLWGAQLEAGAFPTSYIPTTTAAATRSADVASISGSNFSGWYRQDEGTVFVDAQGLGSSVPGSDFQSLATFSDGTNSTRLELGYLTASSAYWNIRSAGSSSVELSPAISSNRRLLAGSYSSAIAEISANGGAAISDVSVTVPTVNKLDIGGANSAAIKEFHGTIRRLVYWGQRLPNNVLQAITQ